MIACFRRVDLYIVRIDRSIYGKSLFPTAVADVGELDGDIRT